jgi:DNA polymerase (family 10)
MSNQDIAKILRNVAASYAIKDEAKYRFQLLAYLKAAEAVEDSSTEIKDLWKEERLTTLAGVGPSIRSHLEELFKTGRVKRFDEVLEGISEAVFPLLDIPSFGPKKAYRLVSHFKLKNADKVIDDLYKLAQEGKIADLDGFGEKSQADIKKAIEEYRLGVNKTSRMVLPFATEVAEKMLEYLKKSPDVLEAYPLGSLRRRKDTIGDVDIAVATKEPAKVLQYFVDYPYKDRIIEKGEATASILISGGKHIDLMVQPPQRFGSLLQHFTGSKAHNVHLREFALKKSLSLSEYGIKKITSASKEQKVKDSNQTQTFETEESFYKALGLPWIPPELREDTGEIERGAAGTLPTLVKMSDIKGDFHLHSSFPIEPSHDMGANSMDEMVQKAISLSYDYIGFSEHNPSMSKHTPKEMYNILKKRSNEIERLKDRYKKSIRIFSLLETDILANGSVALNDECLELLDATLVSIHSSFSMDKKEMTKRVLKGLSHPKAKILSHPTGRLLNQRPGYELDWKEVFAFCKENNKALEINCWPLRLDLPDTLIRSAIEADLKFFINTDSHATSHMDLMRYGVAVARRGWATKNDILNAWEYNRLVEFFNK